MEKVIPMLSVTYFQVITVPCQQVFPTACTPSTMHEIPALLNNQEQFISSVMMGTTCLGQTSKNV